MSSRRRDAPAVRRRYDDRHVTRWNDNCVFCHNVAPNPGLDAATGAFATTVAELGVACEACHGPGGMHARANADPVRRYTLHATGAADRPIVNPSRLSPSRAADPCGRCHGQRMADDIGPFLAHGDPFVPGDDLGLHSAPLWADTPRAGERGAFAARFWNDGTPRLTAYEYQGLLESPCAQRGALSCASCHGMHDGAPRGQVRPAALADCGCTSCHAALAAPAALAVHARHDPAGPGALHRLPYAAHRLRRAGHSPQPSHRGARSGPRRRRGPAGRLHHLPRRVRSGLGRASGGAVVAGALHRGQGAGGRARGAAGRAVRR